MCYFVFANSVFSSGVIFLFTLGVISPGVISLFFLFFFFFFLPGIFSSFRLAYVFSSFHICTYIYCKNKCNHHICTPTNCACWGYTVSMLSIDPCVCPSITFRFLKIFKSLLEFHPTLYIYSYLQEKYFLIKQ